MKPPIEEMLTTAPDFWARMIGSTARVMAASPKKLVSNIARTSASSPSSTAAR
jgi:hypothetical protein